MWSESKMSRVDPPEKIVAFFFDGSGEAYRDDGCMQHLENGTTELKRLTTETIVYLNLLQDESYRREVLGDEVHDWLELLYRTSLPPTIIPTDNDVRLSIW